MRSRTERARRRPGPWSAACALAALLACTEEAGPARPVQPPPPAPVVVVAPADAGAPVEAPLAAGTTAAVTRLSGAVEVKRSGSEEWVTLSIGDAVRAGDQVRTTGEGEVELSLDAARIRVREDSELVLTVLTPREVRATVTGAAEAELPEGERELTLGIGAAVARTTAGTLAVRVDGDAATASAVEGQGSLTVGDQTLELRKGEFTAVRGQAARPAPLPKTVSLAVDWPRRAETNKAELALKGRASAHARVVVAGRRVPVTPDGAFEARVALRRGKQTVTVVAVDPAGRRAVSSKQLILDPDAPSIKARVEYDR